MLLSAGGCAISLGGRVGRLSLLPTAVVVLHGFVLAAIFDWSKAVPVAFYILVTLHAILAVGLSNALVCYGASDPTIYPWGLLLIGAFVLKSLLTWLYVRSG
jgi:hypothetical protein